jgi:hypothetical protein
LVGVARRFLRLGTLAFAIAGLLSRPGSAQSTRWYDDYNAGVAAAKRGDWQQAEPLLQRAKQANPKQGRSVYTYGDRFIEYVPDLWLAQVYANTNREDDATTAIGRLAAILPVGDSRVAAVEKRVAEVKASRPAAVARGGPSVDPGQTTTPSGGNSGAAPAGSGTRPSLPGGLLPGGSPTTYTGTIGAPPPNVPTAAAKIPPTKPSQTFPSGPVNVPPSPSLRNGVLAYFSGDYRSAVPLLETASRVAKDAPRALAFLAFAKVALVLTGGADPTLLQQARVDFQSFQNVTGGPPDNSLSSLISPRVLAELQNP